MGLYNLVFGTQPLAPAVLAMLERTPEDFARFRDAWIEVADGVPRLAVYTRLGGGNNVHLFGECDGAGSSPERCYGCKVLQIESWPCFQSARDDSFDSTYRTFYFRVPEQYAAEVYAHREQLPAMLDTDQRWQEAIAALQEDS